MYRSKKSSRNISTLKDPKKGQLTKDPVTIPSIFNEHFASVGRNLASNLPSSQGSYMNYLAKSTSPASSFFFQPVTEAEVRLEILSIPNGKSHGLYSCPTLMLKHAHQYLSEPLALLINTSVFQGAYPAKLKLFKVVPVFKADDAFDANNYRPPSLLSNFNRIFEKLIYSCMLSYIVHNDILYTGQYGFRKKHSTQHAILDIINSIQGNMDRRLYSCRIFIGLKKAFDTVDHRILLGKLYFYGFRGVLHNWFLSYLTGRKQTTEAGGHISSSETITCGVPQGSVLGPLLFLLFINDIQNSSRKFRFYLFADDTNILYVDKDLRSLEKVVNEEFKNVYNWLAVNKLTINIRKSNFVIFHPHQKKITYQPKDQIYNNETNKLECLEHKEYVKYLGILIDKNFSWRNQIDPLILKISKAVGMIAKLRHFVPRNILLHIHQSISYGLTAWGMASKSALNQILILQNDVSDLHFFQKGELMLSHYFSIPAFCLSISHTMKQCAALCMMSLTKSHPLTS